MIVSLIKGRIRIVDSNIKDAQKVSLIKEVLKKLEGITAVRITENIGSLLITYDETKISVEQILENLEGLVNLEMESEMTKRPNALDKDRAKNFLGDMFKKTTEKKGKKGKDQSGRQGNTSSSSLVSLIADNISGNQIIKTVLLGLVGVKSYNKGKGMYKNR